MMVYMTGMIYMTGNRKRLEETFAARGLLANALFLVYLLQ